MVAVDVVLETDPSDEKSAVGEVEEAFVGDGEYDEDRRKRQEDYD